MATVPKYQRQASPSVNPQSVYQSVNVDGAFGIQEAAALQVAARALDSGQRRLTSGVAAEENARVELEKKRGRAWSADAVAEANSLYLDPENGLMAANSRRKGQDATGMTKDTAKWFDDYVKQKLMQAPNAYGKEYATEKFHLLRTSILKDTSRMESSALNDYQISAVAGELAEQSRGIAAVSNSLTLDEYAERVTQGEELAREYAKLKGISEEAAVEQYKADTYYAGINFLITNGKIKKAVDMLERFGDELDPKHMISTHEHLLKAEDRQIRKAEKAQRKADEQNAALGERALFVDGDYAKAKEYFDKIVSPSQKIRAETKLSGVLLKKQAKEIATVATGQVFAEENGRLPRDERVTVTSQREAIIEGTKDEPVLQEEILEQFDTMVAENERAKRLDEEIALRTVAELVDQDNPDIAKIQEAVDDLPPEVKARGKALAEPVRARTGLGVSPNANIVKFVELATMVEEGKLKDRPAIIVAAEGTQTKAEIDALEQLIPNIGKTNPMEQVRRAFALASGEVTTEDFNNSDWKEYRQTVQAMSKGFTKFIPWEKLVEIAYDTQGRVRLSTTEPSTLGSLLPVRQFTTIDVNDLAEDHAKALTYGKDSPEYIAWAKQWQAVLPEFDDIIEEDQAAVRKFLSTKQGKALALFLADERGVKGSVNARLEMGTRLIIKERIAMRYGFPSVYGAKAVEKSKAAKSD